MYELRRRVCHLCHVLIYRQYLCQSFRTCLQGGRVTLACGFEDSPGLQATLQRGATVRVVRLEGSGNK